MKNKKDAFKQYQESLYSGMYREPVIHPETEKNMPNVPPLKKPKIEKPLPSRGKPKLITITLVLLCLSLVGYLSYIFTSPNPTATIAEHKKVLTMEHAPVMVEAIVQGVVSGVRDLLPEKGSFNRVKIVRIKDGQKAAMEKIKAWERINNKMINEFYNNKNLKGIRKLCVTYGNEKRCVENDRIDIRPELPPYLRRESDAGLTLN
jgi:hypothetical protein